MKQVQERLVERIENAANGEFVTKFAELLASLPIEQDTPNVEKVRIRRAVNTVGRCTCGQLVSTRMESAEVVRDGQHVVVHVNCMLPNEQVA
jgi:hypothetical protein